MQSADVELPGYYIRQIADQVGSLGADVPRWLAQSGLSEAQLGEALVSLSWPAFRKLVLNAQEITHEPALGLLVGERLRVNTHGILGYAAMNSSTIRQGLDLVERYIPLRTALVGMQHEQKGQELRVQFVETVPLGEVQRLVLEAVILAVKNVLDFITMGSCQIRYAAFPFEDAGEAALARDLFKCEVRYQQTWAGFALPLEAIDQPLKMADPAAFQDAAKICQRELEQRTQQESLAARVRRTMLEKQSGFPSLQVIARMFNLSPRTLHRRLLDEGSSYKQILEEVRHMLAVEHLKAGRLTLQEIAYVLGYTDMANFRRAFKRWEGVAPSAYRPA